MFDRDFESWTVGELIDHLEDFDREAVVGFSCTYGDYHDTEQVVSVGRHGIDELELVRSGYSHSGWAVPRDDEDDGAPHALKETIPVVVIRGDQRGR